MSSFQNWEQYSHLLTTLGIVAFLIVILGAWQLLGTGPRMRRKLQRGRRMLDQGNWRSALQLVRQIDEEQVSPSIKKDARRLQGKCLKAAAKSALSERDFEAAYKCSSQAAEVLDKDIAAAQAKVIDAMLAEVRRLFSDGQPIANLVSRILVLTDACQEAAFWLGMSHLRDGKVDAAVTMLETARTGKSDITWTFDRFTNSADGSGEFKPAKKNRFIDPAFYLGAIFLNQGRPKDALLYLTEANRVDGSCPFVTCQLGTALVAAKGDTDLAIRALERALGSRGFAMWNKNPQRAWVEGMPAEDRSFVRRLASEHTYDCPLWGKDAKSLTVQARTSLGQAYQRLKRFSEAARVFDQILQETAPSLPVVRGLGLSLARLGQYDQAFKHLRIAHELSDSDRLTAGYLALCGAKGKPSKDADKARNIAWAIQLVSRFTSPGDEEWVDLVSAIFAEARELGVGINRNDQIYLCEHLLSVKAADPPAADAFHHLQSTSPEDMRPE